MNAWTSVLVAFMDSERTTGLRWRSLLYPERQTVVMWAASDSSRSMTTPRSRAVSEMGEVHHPACSNANPNQNTNPNLNLNRNPNPHLTLTLLLTLTDPNPITNLKLLQCISHGGQ